MDGARLSAHPHLSWLQATVSLRAEAGPTTIRLRSVSHSVSMPVSGRHMVRWSCRTRERSWIENPGTVHFRPVNGEWQDFVIDPAESGDVLACFIPVHHLEAIAREEEISGDVEWKRALLPNDPVIQHAMLTLAACRESPVDGCGRADEAARRLVLRLVAVSGSGTADWHDDVSVFERRTMGHLVEYVDAHLKVAPSLAEMGMRVSLSPSHFAKKFRQSTGLSFHRFVNRRRVLASLDLLKDRSQRIAGIAIDLGFSSQSHFTRLFSGLVGTTPARYRRQFRQTVGVSLPPSTLPRPCDFVRRQEPAPVQAAVTTRGNPEIGR